MEDLTKHQLILIVILISFVTSIATGIMTFTLLQEAPVEVTQNITRVVEKTIEQVAPIADGKPEKTVTTVVVSEEDRVLDAISKNEKSIVRLKTIGSDGTEIFTGIGVVVSSDGIIVADSRGHTSNSYNIIFSDNKIFPSAKTYLDNERGLVFIKTSVPQNVGKYTFYPAIVGNSDLLKIGQTLVAISGKDSNAASIGRVFQLSFGEDKKTVKNIFSDIKVSKTHLGSPVLNLSGEIVGIEAPLVEGDTEYSYVPVNIIKAAKDKAFEELNK